MRDGVDQNIWLILLDSMLNGPFLQTAGGGYLLLRTPCSVPISEVATTTLNHIAGLAQAFKQRNASVVCTLHARGAEDRQQLPPKHSGVLPKHHAAAWESSSAVVVAFGRSRSGNSAVIMM